MSTSSILTILQNTVSAINGLSTAIRARLGNGIVSVKDFGVVGDGVADDTANLNLAFNSKAGAAHLYWPGGTYKITAPILQPSGQRWQGASRTKTVILWAGGNTSDVVVMPSGSIGNIIENFTIEVGTATNCTALHLVDTQKARIAGITMLRTGAGSNSGTGLRLQAGSGGTGAVFNSAFNDILSVNAVNYGVGIQLDGVNAANFGVVTLNTFSQIDLEKITTGVRLAQWTDNNNFFQVRLETEVSNSIGVIYNDSGTPASDVGVYANNFYSLQMDAFGGGLTNVIGVFFNVTKENYIYGLFAGTDPWPGTLVLDQNGRASSYYVAISNIGNSTNNMQIRSKNVAFDGETELVGLSNGLNSNINYFSSLSRVSGPTAAFSVGGFAPNTQVPSDGSRLSLYNPANFAMTIVNEDVSSTAANRIKTLTGANVVLRAGPSFATFSYDGSDARWILESTNG